MEPNIKKLHAHLDFINLLNDIIAKIINYTSSNSIRVIGIWIK